MTMPSIAGSDESPPTGVADQGTQPIGGTHDVPAAAEEPAGPPGEQSNDLSFTQAIWIQEFPGAF
ncbi:MAG: hypothetical protein ACYCZK_01240 [Microbacteriaceae bacterium]